MNAFNGEFDAHEIFVFEGEQWIITDNNPDPMPAMEGEYGAEPEDVIEITSYTGECRRISFKAFWNACESAGPEDLSWA